jgi:hypothetical protein
MNAELLEFQILNQIRVVYQGLKIPFRISDNVLLHVNVGMYPYCCIDGQLIRYRMSRDPCYYETILKLSLLQKLGNLSLQLIQRRFN